MQRSFDPDGIMNPGNLLPPTPTSNATPTSTSTSTPTPTTTPTPTLDLPSLLVSVSGSHDLASLEATLRESGLTLAAELPPSPVSVADWLAAGAPGHRDRWLDPADQLLAGLHATLISGRTLVVRPQPRRSVGPDLAALFLGAGHRFGRIDQAWLRVHRRDERLPRCAPFTLDRDPPLSDDERALVDGAARAMVAPKSTIS